MDFLTGYIIEKENNMQHHFVVFYDDATETWEVDVDSTMCRFDGYNIWSSKTAEYQKWNFKTDDICDKLHDIFTSVNEEK
jgi:hypothetical protein